MNVFTPVVSRESQSDFEAFYGSEFATVYRASILFCGDHEVALEATQEAFSRAFARWKRLHNSTWRTGWVITTALNLCRKHFRDWPRKNQVEESPPSSSFVSAAINKLDVRAALALLPPRQRKAAVLFYVGDLSMAQVAHLMGISEGAVKSHLSRARGHLHHALEDRKEH